MKTPAKSSQARIVAARLARQMRAEHAAIVAEHTRNWRVMADTHPLKMEHFSGLARAHRAKVRNMIAGHLSRARRTRQEIAQCTPSKPHASTNPAVCWPKPIASAARR